MTRGIGIKNVRSLPLLAGCLTVAITGCAGFQRIPLGGQGPPSSDAQEEATGESAVDDTEATLSAVEEFLERTGEYQMAGGPVVGFGSSGALPLDLGHGDHLGVGGGRPGGYAEGQRGIEPIAAPPSAKGSTAFENRTEPGVYANTHVTLDEAPPRASLPALPIVRMVSIPSAQAVEESVEHPALVSSANAPVGMPSGDRPVSLDRIVPALAARAAAGTDFDAEWQLRLVELALFHDRQAVNVSSGFSPEVRTIMSSLMSAATAIRDALRDPLLPGDRALASVEELRDALADRADPVVSEIALCRKVVTFGVYDQMKDTDFIAGRTTPTIVYSEIDNLHAEPTEDGLYETRLATRLEVLAAEGKSVLKREEPEIVDRCRRPRRDFFIAQRITLPPTLPAGDYVLKLLVEDILAGKSYEASHPFVISSAIAAAGYP